MTGVTEHDRRRRPLARYAVPAACGGLAVALLVAAGLLHATDPTVVLLRQGDGYGRVVQAGTALAGLVGACDGELAVGPLVGALAALLEVPADALAAELMPQPQSAITALVVPFLSSPEQLVEIEAIAAG